MVRVLMVQLLLNLPAVAEQRHRCHVAVPVGAEKTSGRVNGHYLVLCSIPLSLQGATIGKLYVAHDITHDQTMFMALIRSLSIATLLSILY